jgi:hypothetical protein
MFGFSGGGLMVEWVLSMTDEGSGGSHLVRAYLEHGLYQRDRLERLGIHQFNRVARSWKP